ncbi:hypothetical protein J4G07_00340 [Candidatus Poribacteria bacterium]|nr:hypothetical protein [Candidatus Poribacteria bacterium]
MRQYVLRLTEATPHAGDERDNSLGDWISLKTRAFKIANANACRYWNRTRLWRRHRPRSEQAGILRCGTEGGLHAFA